MKKISFLTVLIESILILCSLGLVCSCSKSDSDSEKDKEEEKALYEGKILSNQTIESKYLGGEKGTFNIYLPSDYATSDKKYPVLYLFHGMAGDNTDWTKNGVQSMTDVVINQGDMVPLIIVMPKAWNSFYVDGLGLYDGDAVFQYESFFFNELKPYIEETYPVNADRSATAIAGLSMGGFGASYYAFKYPESFCLCYSMSGALEGIGSSLTPSVKDLFTILEYTSEDYDSLPKYFMDCGTGDFLVGTANTNTDSFLRSINFPHTYRTSAGGHDWAFWRTSYRTMISDLNKVFKTLGQ